MSKPGLREIALFLLEGRTDIQLVGMIAGIHAGLAMAKTHPEWAMEVLRRRNVEFWGESGAGEADEKEAFDMLAAEFPLEPL